MKQSLLLIVACSADQPHSQWKYPPTKTVDARDTYFGGTYPDSYRWLEDMKDPNVVSWFKAQAN